jgi:hypothetical protein
MAMLQKVARWCCGWDDGGCVDELCSFLVVFWSVLVVRGHDGRMVLIVGGVVVVCDQFWSFLVVRDRDAPSQRWSFLVVLWSGFDQFWSCGETYRQRRWWVLVVTRTHAKRERNVNLVDGEGCAHAKPTTTPVIRRVMGC